MDENEYLSDDDFELIQDTSKLDLDNMCDLTEEEIQLQEETMRYVISRAQSKSSIFSSTSSIESLCTGSGSCKSKKEKDRKINKKLSFNDLNVIMDKKLEEMKPKKFVSVRSLERKQLSEPKIKVEPKIVTRQFNPRKVPYFYSDEYNKQKKFANESLDINDSQLFPSL
uniref:Uncharacterized protein n=1 Tax=viral metagenome TaxID=1070528 RepID=A0A6C0DA12_9ZZZZ